MENNNTQLPAEVPQHIHDKINTKAQEYESATQHEGLGPAIFKDGVMYAMAYAKIEADKAFQKEYDALKECSSRIESALKQFISYHETGLLPDRFTYEKGVEAMKGEGAT